MLSKQLIKVISLFSAIIGALAAVPALIPLFTVFVILIMFIVTAPFIILYLKNLKLFSDLSVEKCAAIGAISGASVFLGFSIIFFPIGFLLNLIFKIQSLIWVKVIFSNFGFLMLMIFLMTLTCAMFNTFAGVSTAYFYQIFNTNKK